MAAVMFNFDTVYEMRQAGASLQQIAEMTCKSKERIRQLLVKNCGSTKFNLLSTAQLCGLLGLSRHQIVNLYEGRTIMPMIEWNTGKHHRLFWSPRTVEKVISHCQKNRLCRMCSRPIPKGRRVYCSQRCYQEGQKYIYKDARAKERRLISIRRSIQKRKLLEMAQTIAREQLESNLVLMK
jgi:predicted nucleic acid-binding Zn ribbon protein